MNKSKKFLISLLGIINIILIMGACSNESDNVAKKEVNQKEQLEEKYDELAKEKNEELTLEPLILTDYSIELSLELVNPQYEYFAVNGEVVIEGSIAKYNELKSNYVWIKVVDDSEGPAGNKLEYYAPIKNGKFKEKIHFFNGEGEYTVTIHLPDTESKNYYYEAADFKIFNVSPKQQRDLAFTPAGQVSGLSLNLEQSFIKEDGIFLLEGSAEYLADDTIMLYLNKEMDSWKHVIPVKNGKFSCEIPLYYGEGVHNLEIMIPDQKRESYYESAINILIDNQSKQTVEPIEFFGDLYITRGVNLKKPSFSGIEAGQSVRITGNIDPKADFAENTTHLYITTKKGDDEALDVIPVEDFSFDSSPYLRFGPGTYELTLSVPEIVEEKSDYFRYFSVAKFKVESKEGMDRRDLLPSRGVQSDDTQLIDLAKNLTRNRITDRDKAEAIYEYVAKNISYDVEKLKNNEFSWDDSALKTFEERSGVCQDYAYLTIALLRASEIQARFVEGTAGGSSFGTTSNERHAWVEAKIDGQWLTMDPTWGAGYIEGDKFVNSYSDAYFDPNPAEFAKTHERIGVAY